MTVVSLRISVDFKPVGLVNRVRNTGDFVVPGFVIMQFTVTLAGGLNDISY